MYRNTHLCIIGVCRPDTASGAGCVRETGLFSAFIGAWVGTVAAGSGGLSGQNREGASVACALARDNLPRLGTCRFAFDAPDVLNRCGFLDSFHGLDKWISVRVTINPIGNGTVLLAENPDQREMLRANMDLLPGAILEMLRMESPAQLEPLRVAESVVCQGKEIPSGQEIILLLGAANRDERHFKDPDRFDVERNPQDRLALGFGIRKCLGRHLALLEARVYFEELLKGFPNYPIGETRRLVSSWSRAFAAVDFKCAS